MATPTFTTDLTPISMCDSTTDWTITGMGGIDTEIQVEGSGCLYIEAKSVDAIQGAMFDMGTPIDLSGSDRLMFYLYLAARGFLYSMAGGGVSVRMEDSNGYWAEWDIGGNDTWWCGEGWHRIVQDANQTPDETGGGGTFDPSDVKEVGFSCWYTAQLKGPAAAIDAVYYGTYVEITGGTSGDPVTLQDIVDNDTNGYGFVYTNKSGVYELVGQIYIGDISGASDTYFKTTNEKMMWTDQFIPVGESKLIAAEDSGSTEIVFGEYDGSGDDRVGYAGSLMYAVQDIWGLGYGIDFSASITTCLIYGSTFQNADDGIDLSAAPTDNEVISTTFTSCGEVDPDNAVVRKCFFVSTSADSSAAALLWSANTDLDNCSFLVNIGADISAIRHTDGTTRTYYDILFSGNTYDVFLNHASADLTINKDGTSNPSTYRSSGSGSVIFVGTVNLKITVKDADGNVIVGARVFLEAETGGADDFEETVTITESGGTATVTHSGHNMSDGEMVAIRGANEPEYNGGGKVITYISSTQYSYAVSGGPASPATGTITSTHCYIFELTISGGVAEQSYAAGATQPARGWVRHSTSPDLYEQAPLNITDISGGIDLPAQIGADT